MTKHALRAGWLLVLLLLLTFLPAINFLPGLAQSTKSESQSRQVSQYAELGKVPEGARNRRNPLESDSNAVTAGRKLFERHCAECHGNTGDGGKKGPSLRAQEVRNATPGMLFWILSNGVVRRGMPVWSKLPEPQRWQIVSYLKSLD